MTSLMMYDTQQDRTIVFVVAGALTPSGVALPELTASFSVLLRGFDHGVRGPTARKTRGEAHFCMKLVDDAQRVWSEEPPVIECSRWIPYETIDRALQAMLGPSAALKFPPTYDDGTVQQRLRDERRTTRRANLPAAASGLEARLEELELDVCEEQEDFHAQLAVLTNRVKALEKFCEAAGMPGAMALRTIELATELASARPT